MKAKVKYAIIGIGVLVIIAVVILAQRPTSDMSACAGGSIVGS